MKLSQAATVVRKAVESNLELSRGKRVARDAEYVTPILTGAPGLGKTSIVEQVAKELDIKLEKVILAQFEPGELAGFPIVKGDTYVRARPFFLPKEGEGILFLDELMQAGTANMNIAAQLINERRIGEHELGDGWTIVCAGNRQIDRAGTTQMPSHLKDRLMHLYVDCDLQDVLKYFSTRQMAPEVVGFLRHRPEWVHKFDPNVDASPTPRSWERCNSVIAWGLPLEEEMEALAGIVGKAAVADFIGFKRLFKEMPDPSIVLAQPDTAPIPEDPAILYALTAALAAHVNKTNAKNLIAYIDRLPAQEFAAYAIKDTVQRNPELKKDNHVSKWILTKGKDLLL